MANVIKIKRSSVKDDSPEDLEYGELALNYTDAKLYFKSATGSIGYFEGVPSTPIGGTSVEPTDSDVLIWMNI